MNMIALNESSPEKAASGGTGIHLELRKDMGFAWSQIGS
jgi:hypothetical protein